MLYKVLVVEDEVFMREGLKNIINWQELGFEIVGEAEDGKEALEFLKNNQVDLLITDIKIPLINGLDLIDRMKKELKNPPEVIIISGYADFEYAKTAIKHGVVNYILKPIEEEELIDTLLKVKSNLKKKELIRRGENLLELRRRFEDVLAKEEISIEDGAYIAIVYFKEMSNWLSLYFDERIERILDNIKQCFDKLREDKLVYPFSESQGKYYAIIKSEDAAKKGYEFMKKTIEFASEIIVSVSRRITNKDQFFEGISQATYCLNFALFYDQFGIYFYEDALPNSKEVLYSKEYDKKLILAIEENDDEKLLSIIEIMVTDFKDSKCQLDFLRAYINYIVISVTSYFSKLGLNLEDEIEWFSRLQPIFVNLETIEKALNELCKSIRSKFKQWKSNSSNSIMNQLEKFIRENYNKNLTLKAVAQKFYLNPVYLGQLFKKHHGMYFNSYLQKIRIEEAKKLLMSTDMKIYEISQAVGYNDTDYFVQCFTKLCNMTPNQYRKKYKGDDK